MTRFSVAAVVLALCAAGAALPAQDRDLEAPRDGAVQEPVAPPLAADGRRIQPRGTLYDVVVRTDSGPRHVGWHTVWVYEASFAGRPAWEVLERRSSHAPYVVRATQDSSVLRRDDLQPLRWEAAAGEARLVAAFANDSVYGGATSPEARATFTVAVPGQVVTSEGALDVLLQAAPLAEGWQAGTALLAADLSGARLVPLALSVLRTESIEVPAGRFDAWVVQASAPGVERTIWVDRRTQLVLRTLEAPAHMPGMNVERVLVGGY